MVRIYTSIGRIHFECHDNNHNRKNKYANYYTYKIGQRNTSHRTNIRSLLLGVIPNKRVLNIMIMNIQLGDKRSSRHL